jgi:Fe-S-cluster-containing hydrogenase component 2
MAYKWLPIVDAERCTGCGLCVDACGPRSLEMVAGIATLVLAHTCWSEEHCIAVCRDDAIRMAWLPFSGDASVGQWRDKCEPAEQASRTENPHAGL